LIDFADAKIILQEKRKNDVTILMVVHQKGNLKIVKL
jgi:hypothetical protein